MIIVSGDIFADPAPIRAVPVNTRGVCGAGLAKAWAARYPNLDARYKWLCRLGRIAPGSAHDLGGGWWALATKDGWWAPSQIGWIRSACEGLAAQAPSGEIALPALGAGLGGLPFDEVAGVVAEVFGDRVVRLHKPRGRQLDLFGGAR